MTIENPEAFVRGLWNWAILDGCFGKSKIKPTDIDGEVNRKYQWLVLEAKAPTETLDPRDGQYINFLQKCQTGKTTVIVIWGDTNVPQRVQIFHKGHVGEPFPCDLEKLRRIVSHWYELADREEL